MEQRLSLVTLGVADVAAARRFYEEGLGFTNGSGQDDIAFYQLAGIVLAVWSRAELAGDANITDTGATFGGITIAYNTRSHDEVDDVLAKAVSAGGTVLKPPEEMFWGGYSGYFADPDGHAWEVAWNPDWAIDDAGHVSLSKP